MANKKPVLPKFVLAPDKKREDWVLKEQKTEKVIKHFETKEAGTKGGVLKKAVGKEGGSVRIEKKKGGFQEERTYPRSRDPKKSKG